MGFLLIIANEWFRKYTEVSVGITVEDQTELLSYQSIMKLGYNIGNDNFAVKLDVILTFPK